MKRLYTIFVLLIVNILGVTALVFTFEYGLRVSHLFEDKLPLNGVHGSTRFTWGHEVTLNAYGFREREFELLPHPESTRILVVGDSITWGAGLSENQRYSAIVEGLLNRAFPDRTFEVLNLSKEGASTLDELTIVTSYLPLLRPDMLIVGFCINDPQPKGQDYSPEKAQFRKDYKDLLLFRWTLDAWGFKELGRVWESAIYKFGETTGIIPTWEVALDRSYDTESENWLKFSTALSEISKQARNYSVYEPILVILNQGTSTTAPTDFERPDRYLQLFDKWYDQVEQEARRLGFTVLRHEVLFRTRLKGQILAVNAKDGHPSAEMNKIYAEHLYNYLSQRLES